MAKSSTQTYLQPERFSTTAPVIAEDCIAVVEQLNHAAQYWPQSHVNVCCAPYLGLEAGAPAALTVAFPSLTDGWRTVLLFGIDIQLETQELTVGARARIGVGEEVELRVTVTPSLGLGTPLTALVLAFDDTDTAEVTGTIDVSGVAAGTERECHVQVEVQTTTATAEQSWLQSFRLEDSPLAALPDPVDE